MEAVKRRDVDCLDRMLGENFVLTTGRAGAEGEAEEREAAGRMIGVAFDALRSLDA